MLKFAMKNAKNLQKCVKIFKISWKNLQKSCKNAAKNCKI